MRIKRYSWLPLLPFFIFTGYFLLWPILGVTLKSLHDNNGNWSLSNYTPLLSGAYRHAFITSIRLSVITSLISSVLGGFFTFVIVKSVGTRLTAIIESIAAVFANSGGVPLAFMYIAAFGAEGMFTKILKFFGWNIYAGHFTLFSFTGVVMVYTFFMTPLMVIVFRPAILGLRKEWSEASLNLGATPLTYWRRVAVPILTPSFIGSFFLLFAGAFSAYATARALTVGTVPLVPIIIGTLVDGNVISNEANLGDALAVGMILVAAIAMVGYLWAQRSAAKWRVQ
jgi:putative spermidine/putrescine transport system permease protein